MGQEIIHCIICVFIKNIKTMMLMTSKKKERNNQWHQHVLEYKPID
jgi:hypothetical protein